MSTATRPSTGSMVIALLLAAALVAVAGLPARPARADVRPDHLVVSEVVTGGASASDEFIEIYNPTDAALPLEGLELVYVTASGATISRRAAWQLGAPELGPGRHLLVANELGVYAGIADALYASGMASTGGSVALRIQGASSAIDAVGWGTAVSTWLEGLPAAAPSAGTSLERLPGGVLGSTVDTDDNLEDFASRTVPEPQNLVAAAVPEPGTTPPPSPSGSPDPTASPEPTPLPTPSPTPTPSSGSGAVPIATARALPDGAGVTVEGTALTGSDFTDGGGFVADESGGIAVIVTGGAFARGDVLLLDGTVDDRFSQRTLRVDAADMAILGAGDEPAPTTVATGAIDEGEEGRLVRVSGAIVGSASELASGLAFDFDDGSGPTRLVVATATAIDVSAWRAGTTVDLVGLVGQRDATGSGTTGYRVHPRDVADVLAVGAPPTPSPEPSESGSPQPSASEAPAGVISIAAARQLPKNAPARVRGTVTMVAGIVDPTTAVVQDASGAIVLRIGEEVGALARGEVLTVDGIRSTKSGMETLRVSSPPTRSGHATEPAPRELRTGTAGEADEAQLVVVRGGLVAAARRSSSGTISFEIDDGSGPLRVSIGAPIDAPHDSFTAGTWVEVTGVLGQDTTGAQPLRGYRVWPRDAADVRVLATPTGTETETGSGTDRGGGDTPSTAGLDAIGGPAGDDARIGATLVSAGWPELEVGGLLWDGTRLVALDPSAAAAVERLLAGSRPPLSVELTGLRAVGTLDGAAVPLVRLGSDPDGLLRGDAAPAPPATTLPATGDAPRWVSVVGRLAPRGDTVRMDLADGRSVALDIRCTRAESRTAGVAGVTGIATTVDPRIVVPCGGIRAASTLGRTLVGASPGPAVPTARLAGLEGDSTARSRPALVSAALLGLAALGLLGGALVARRFEVGGVIDSEPDVPEPDDEPGARAAPVLTLVPLPRDRAP